MNESNVLKLILAAAMAAVGSYFKQLAWPFVVLVLVMSVDYITGIHAAFVRDELRSRAGLLGFLKKLSYIAMVIVGCVCDYLMTTLSAQLTGSAVVVQFVGLTVICWLIINELISILENIGRIGAPVPPFIQTLLQHLKQTTEAQAPVQNIEQHEKTPEAFESDRQDPDDKEE